MASVFTEARDLDINKVRGDTRQIEPIRLRRGENGLTNIEGHIKADGQAYNLTGITVKFRAVNSLKQSINETATVTNSTNGIVTYTVSDKLTSVEGEIAVAYFDLISGTNVITSDSIPILILSNTDISTGEAEQYRNQLDALIAELEGKISDVSGAVKNANDAATKANTATTNANNATTKANSAATSATNAASEARNAASDASTAATNANKAKDSANTAATNAQNAAKSANDAATKANTAATRVETAVSNADTAANKANDAASDANIAASSANDAASSANDAATNARTATTDANSAATKANTAAKSANDAVSTVNKAMDDFRTITGADVHFGISDSPTEIPSVWETRQLPVDKGRWSWTRVTWHYNQGPDTVEYSKAYSGRDGEFDGEYRVQYIEGKVNAMNDLTTGINLLRGTRDFISGNAAFSSFSSLMVDGWNNTSNKAFSKDKDGFTVIIFNPSNSSSNGLSSPITNISKNETYTVSIDFMIENVDEYGGNSIVTLQHYKGSSAMEQFTIPIDYIKSVLGNIQSGEWYTVSRSFTITKDVADNSFLFLQLNRIGTTGVISFRKPCVYKGRINNPIWSASPFDVAQVSEQNAYPNGTYSGVSIADKFANEIGSTHIATWLQSRVKAGNFSGLNIMDYVDIDCDGINMRYRIAAIDPYFGGGDQQKGHNIVMVPDRVWTLTAEKDGDYAINTSYVYWNEELNNNGTSTDKHPYTASNLHKWEIEKMLPRFPQEWQDAMLSNRVLLEERYSSSSKLNDSTDWSWADLGKIWSLSETELFGQCVWGTNGYSVGTDCRLPIFENCRGRLGRSGSVIRADFWLRTVKSGSPNNVCNFSSRGYVSYVGSNNTTMRPLPCFMIG